MSESPLSASPYEVLRVDASASDDDLRRAYRRRLRLTHPDAGGSATEFHNVQLAWQRIGTPEDRAAYDRGHSSPSYSGTAATEHTWAATGKDKPRHDSRPKARSYGHPGGYRRERFLRLMREWSGRGVALEDPYEPSLVRSAPREIRHALADALAEEATARALASLGIGYTIWHDVATDERHLGEKIDHVVLGPSGLFAIQSEDWGTEVELRRGDLVGENVDKQPLRSIATKAKGLGRAGGVRFSIAAVIVPDDAFADTFVVAGKTRGITTVAATLSSLPQLMRTGVKNAARPDRTELFEVRTRLHETIRFV